MSQEFKGFVAKLSEKTGQGRNGPWTAYSAKLERKDGTEYDQWLSFGFENPGIKEGDYIAVQAEENSGRMQVVAGTLKTSTKPPARAQKQSTSSGNAGGSTGSKPKWNGNAGSGSGGYRKPSDGTGIQNRTNPEDAKRMTFANARSSAIELVGLLLLNDALPITGAKTKAGQASRFDEVTAAVDKIAVKFFNDSMSLRLLDTVADTVTDTKADGELPDTETKDDSNKRAASAAKDAGTDDDGFAENGSAGADTDFE